MSEARARKQRSAPFRMKPFKETVRRLEKELHKKQKEVNKLEQTNNALRVRDTILTAYSINLAWLRDHAAAESGAVSLASVFSHDTSAEELQLLNQLQGLSISAALGPRLWPGPSIAAAAAAAAPGCSSTLSASSSSEVQPLAPDGDPLYLLRYICCMSPFPGAATMTAEQLVAEYASAVQQLGLQLSLYRAEQQVPPVLSSYSMGQQTPVQKMQEIISRLQWLRATLALTGRSDLIRMQYIISCENPAKQVPEPSVEQHARALELLGLSQQQLQRLVDGYMVFHAMIDAVLQELQVVQQQHHLQQQSQRQHLQQLRQQLQQSNGLSSDNTGSHGGGSGSTTSSDSDGSAVRHGRTTGVDGAAGTKEAAAAAAAAHVAYRQGLCKQEEFTARMDTLLKKDTRIRVAVAAYLQGQLSLLQMAQLHVYMWPFVPNLALLARAAMARMQQSDQQQQQQT